MADSKRCQCAAPRTSHSGGRCLACGGVTVTRYASRYFCPHRGKPGAGLIHSSGSGKPRRQLCEGCGGTLMTAEGKWGVFLWNGARRYPESAAFHVYLSETRAQARADELQADPKTDNGPGGFVVRWVPKE